MSLARLRLHSLRVYLPFCYLANHCTCNLCRNCGRWRNNPAPWSDGCNHVKPSGTILRQDGGR